MTKSELTFTCSKPTIKTPERRRRRRSDVLLLT